MAVICWGRWELRGEREAAALSAGGVLGLAALAGVVDHRAEGRQRRACRLRPHRDGAPEKFGDKGLATGLSATSALTPAQAFRNSNSHQYTASHMHT
eukprot:scaffold10436_cov94-Phaeocystis_antarctica.AAC.1